MNENIIVTAAFPFIPAKLNIAHMASTYIPADVYNRYLKLFGYHSMLISATDVHGVWVKREVVNSHVDIENLKDSYHENYQKELSSFHISFDHYGRTDSENLYNMVVNSLIKLKEKGYITKEISKNYYCNSCLEFLPKRFRIATKETTQSGKMKLNVADSNDFEYECAFCKSKDIKMVEKYHWFMDLPKALPIIKDEIEKQNNVKLRNYLESIVEQGLSKWDFTRDNYFGIKIPFEDSDQYVYLWYDSLVGYLDLLPKDMDIDSVSFSHFMGKNIVYYHSILWPLILREGFGCENVDYQISPRGFLNLKQSDEDLVDISVATNKFNGDYLRFYILYRTPDSMTDFLFTVDEMKEIINSILCRQIGGFFKRCRGILMKYEIKTVPEISVSNQGFEDSVKLINEYILQMKCNKALLEAINYIKKCGKVINDQELYRNTDEAQVKLLCVLLAGGLLLMKPFVPEIINDYNIFEDFKLDSIDEIESLDGKNLCYNENMWEQIL